MRTRTLALIVAAVVAVLLSACTGMPNLVVPTTAPAIAPTGVEPAEPTATAVTVSPVATDPGVTSPLPAPTLEASAAVAPTVSAPITPTVVTTGTTGAGTAIVGTPIVTETVPVSPEMRSATPVAPARDPAYSTYRDDFAGFEIDYPAAWSVVDVTSEIKQQSTSYSITFMSWRPQEPGGQGIPEGGSKIDLSVTKGTAASTAAAVENRRQELAAAGTGSQITFEEPWDLEGGLDATHWTIQTASGETIHELVTAINGHVIVISGLGDASVFEQIAMTLRPSAATRIVSMAEATPLASETPAAQAQEKIAIPMVATGNSDAAAAAVAPAAQAAAATTYTVQRGDTLAKIAARFGVTVRAILQANPQIKNADQIYAGQRITIPAAGGNPPPPPAGTTRVNIYMIGEGGGNIGCGDQVVAVRRDVPKTPAPLTAALNLLLSQKSQYYGESGLYNALYQSNLSIAGISRVGTAWTIRLTGTLVLGGACDNPRVQAQLEQTALQFSTVKSVRYFINGQPLETALSGR